MQSKNDIIFNKREKLNLLIRTTAEVLGLDEHVVEKDFFVTRLIHAVSNINNDYYELIFQGGTCLAKAYMISPRMSEDCDFRIRMKEVAFTLSREKKRHELRSFRQTICDKIRSAGFTLDDNKIRVRDEGRFVSLEIEYPSIYATAKTLKPHIAVDLFLGHVRAETKACEITSLISRTHGESTEQPACVIECISVIETAAEKWVGLTRRIATIQYREYYYDAALVRHIYDIDKIKKANFINDEFYKNVKSLIETEREKYKSHNVDYFNSPAKEIRHSLKQLTEPVWQKNWDDFVSTMVFEANPPTYKKALESFFELSEKCLSEIEKQSDYNHE